MRPSASLALLMLVASCSSSVEPSALLVTSTQRLQYNAGDSVVVRFANLGDETIDYNACFATLQRRAGAVWQDLGPATGDVPCLGNTFHLQAGAVDSVIFGLTSNQPAATYRYALSSFRRNDGSPLSLSDRTTNPFLVR